MTKKGLFITFEGGEGTGKTTQIRYLQENLSRRGVNSMVTREPGGTRFGDQVRTLLFSHLSPSLSLEEEILLLTAARHYHLRTIIEPALSQGQWVLCDRFIDSTFVYQGFVYGKEISWIENIHQSVKIMIYPDVTFLCQQPLEKALSRRYSHKASCNRFDYKNRDFHEKVALGYRCLAEKFSDRYITLLAGQSIEETAREAITLLEEKFPFSVRDS